MFMRWGVCVIYDKAVTSLKQLLFGVASEVIETYTRCRHPGTGIKQLVIWRMDHPAFKVCQSGHTIFAWNLSMVLSPMRSAASVCL